MPLIHPMRNISIGDVTLIYLSYLKHLNIFKKMTTFLLYRKIYRNSFSVLIKIMMKKYPINGVLRNGNRIVLHNIMEAQTPCGRNIFGGRHEGIKYDILNDIVTLSVIRFNLQGTIRIYGGVTNGDIVGIFVDNTFRDLPVKNKIIVDIGANIADSAIYFALCGANKVICIEPFPKNFELAQKNIKLNNFSDKISIIQAGCSNKRGEINIDPAYSNGAFSTMKEFKEGIKVPLLTLQDILNENNLHSDGSIVLKMDCEGCEYDSILSADENTLQKFNHIMIEYHYGYKNLKQKLEKSGFRVSLTRPRIESWPSEITNQRSKLLVGLISAKKIK
jgi:FkbM family methyltransferase